MEELNLGAELAYGHWWTVAVSAIGWLLALYYLLQPHTAPELWRFAPLCAFMIDEFVELYGFPLTLHLFAENLSRFPSAELLTYRAGDLWRVLFGVHSRFQAFDWFHIGAGVLIFGGLVALYYARVTLRAALESGVPATTGPYAWVRHPQYLALFSMLLGYVIQGPTLITLVLLPIVVYAYVRLGRREEREVAARFGPAYRLYMERTPGFVR